jgi:hypothetical protein
VVPGALSLEALTPGKAGNQHARTSDYRCISRFDDECGWKGSGSNAYSTAGDHGVLSSRSEERTPLAGASTYGDFKNRLRGRWDQLAETFNGLYFSKEGLSDQEFFDGELRDTRIRELQRSLRAANTPEVLAALALGAQLNPMCPASVERLCRDLRPVLLQNPDLLGLTQSHDLLEYLVALLADRAQGTGAQMMSASLLEIHASQRRSRMNCDERVVRVDLSQEELASLSSTWRRCMLTRDEKQSLRDNGLHTTDMLGPVRRCC